MAKEIWRLLEPNVDVFKFGDEYLHGESWYRVLSGFGLFVPKDTIYRRRVTIPDAAPEANHIDDKTEMLLLKNQADAWSGVFNELLALCGRGSSKNGESGRQTALRLIREMHADAAKWREYKCEPSPIPGMPDGWELCQVGKGLHSVSGEFGHIDLVVRRITPPAPEPEPESTTWKEAIDNGLIGNTPVNPIPLTEAGDIDLMKMLEDANQALRSAYSIAERDGKETGWEQWRKRLSDILIQQHRVLHPKPPAPVCVFPRGVFPDGWITPAAESTGIRFHKTEPKWLVGSYYSKDHAWVNTNALLHPITWRADLKPHEKIVRVGPSVEKENCE